MGWNSTYINTLTNHTVVSRVPAPSPRRLTDDMNTALVQGVVDSGEALPANGDAAHADAAVDKKARQLARRNVATLITCTSFMLSLYGWG